MKENKISIRIYPLDLSESPTSSKISSSYDRQTSEPLDSRYAFWSYVSNAIDKESTYPERQEYTFRKNFAGNLKKSLQDKFRNELTIFEGQYNIDFNHPFLDEYFNRKDERFYFDEFINGVGKLQELKNNFFKDNKEYQALLNKIILATQIDFQIDNISYSSIGFDLSIEPFEKAIDLFDNNFEYFRIFLDQYIPKSFLSSLSVYDDRLPLGVSINSTSEFKNDFEKTKDSENQSTEEQSATKDNTTTKWDKAKWLWSLTNGSLVVPVILALVILFVTFNKIESIFKIRQDNYKEIQIENEKILKNYQELIDLQNKTYNDLLKNVKNDTIE